MVEPWPTVADIPAAGTVLAPGDPVLTVFARGAGIGSTMAQLKARAARWRWRIDGWPS
jgi:predicted ATP-grasp superfamily ATP-dependent carboligase